MSNDWQGGEVLICGGTEWPQLGRSKGKRDDATEAKFPNLLLPHRIKSLMDVKIAFISGGPAACHVLAGDLEGRLYTWGRNEKGQLGHGDTTPRNNPTVVEALVKSNAFVTSGCGGRSHTVVVTKSGDSYAFGLNTHGQCGTGSVKAKGRGAEDLLLTPTRCLVPGAVTQVACGVDFSLWLCDQKVYAAGCGQYGVLGDGSDHSYNAKDSSIQIVFEAVSTPKLVQHIASQNVIRIASGQQHCMALDDGGNLFSWGNGGYGRLGHKIQQDEFKPRRIDTFTGRNAVPRDAVLSGGQTSSFCLGNGPCLYQWGKLKVSGDNQTYPAASDLTGWNIRSMACGPNTFAIAAENSVITWGQAIAGELGYGPLKKSSANPMKCEALEGGYVHQVAAGLGFTAFLVSPSHPKVAGAPVWCPPADLGGADVAKSGGKARGAAAAAAAVENGAEAEKEEEEQEEEEEEDEEAELNSSEDEYEGKKK
eukprot:CAMPEP_0175059402 /NCGR_PEP_ID=MMETSP0052_2-20121109/12413_1 /TAXON_ID=51329 ORGANISM="Polytomella parva, Strain SAG 63-3" /NCGR_SAMPLE_ID=MMETSP0052_2 /ASSEMBLY_ACC=CAM_ASM_000194 /LENGTH=477 /DNA_ID=CAMNT_0016324949 /DNA_START=27 /DNA_END=1457 /DNA_ORIENTATION=-